MSYADVWSIRLDRDHEESIEVGDVVRTGLNATPQFNVVAVSGDKVWLRNVHTGSDAIAPMSRCRKVAAAA
jgi:hypothetical protein